MSTKHLRTGILGVWLAGLLIVEIGWYLAWSGNMGPLSEKYIGIGSLFGLVATYLFLTQLMLISGDRFIEARWGLDRLARSHGSNGKYAFYILLLHVTFVVVGYNLRTGGGVADIPLTYKDMVFNLAGVALAATALWLFVFVIVSSIVMTVRKRLSYEWWHGIHFVTYLAVLLPIFHQLALGATLTQDWYRAYWIGLYVVAFGTIIWYKWLRPIFLYQRYKFTVTDVEAEADGVKSIYVSSERKFTWQPGQFAFWWAPVKSLWYEPHPYTISAAPNEQLRFTPKVVGSGSEKMQQLQPGDPILIDGPYGRFSPVVQTKKKRLFIAGGIGVTPIRAMLGAKVNKSDILLYGARTKSDLAFYDDFVKWSKKKGLQLSVVLSEGSMKHAEKGYIDKNILSKITDLAERDVWLCGPPAMMKSVETALQELGIPKSQIHTEKFSL